MAKNCHVLSKNPDLVIDTLMGGGGGGIVQGISFQSFPKHLNENYDP